MDVVLSCVPTPRGKTRASDPSRIQAAVDAIQTHLRPGQLIALECIPYPGTTTDVVLPALQRAGLKAGEDFHLCVSPERVGPGDRAYTEFTVPRIVAGVTPACAEVATGLFARIASQVITVSSPEVAEMVVLLEHAFRAVNIGLANEMALMCRALGADVWEVIAAAGSKPFGFMPFYPGPGLGGHSVPADPLYRSWKARLRGVEPRLMDLAQQVNGSMPLFVVSLLAETFASRGRSVNGSRILVLGVASERDVDDVGDSPAVEIIGDLTHRGATVLYHDPYVPTLTVGARTLESVPLDDLVLAHADGVLILTDHSMIDYKRVVAMAATVVDTRNATAAAVDPHHKVVRL
jgi:UDP-N-acetyl-D-glucosamine dehydrogenase